MVRATRAALAVCLLAAGCEAAAGGFAVETSYVSSYGADAYGLVHARALGAPDLEVGVLGVGGTRPGWLATAGRRVPLGGALVVSGELQLGMLREAGPAAGWRAGAALSPGGAPLAVVAEVGAITGMGWRAAAGVDAPLGPTWSLAPRLRLETWAGERDPMLRAGLGARREGPGGWWIAAEASAGGRDVLHMGPGGSLSLGRQR